MREERKRDDKRVVREYGCVGKGSTGRVVSFYGHAVEEWKKNVNEHGLAPATRRAYDKAWDRWSAWVRMADAPLQTLDPRYPTLELLGSYIYFYCIFYQVSTVQGYVKRAGTVCREKGGVGLSKKEWEREINRTYKAAAKSFPQIPRNRRRPLTVQILRKIKGILDPKLPNDRALWALLCLGVFTLARIGELVPGRSSSLKVTRKAVQIRGDHGILSLVGTKTDKERKGVQMHFFKNKTECCPVEAMNAYLTGRAGSSPTAPLFVDEKGQSMTQGGVVARVRVLLRQIGLDGEEFSGISLRRGGAQTLLRLGASDKIIMGMGRWKSSCFKRYLAVEEDDILQWQGRMADAE
jgi:hypothetical protein